MVVVWYNMKISFVLGFVWYNCEITMKLVQNHHNISMVLTWYQHDVSIARYLHGFSRVLIVRELSYCNRVH
jgi:hypothetical protein